MTSLPNLIVAAVDGSEESLASAHYAIDFARLTGARVVALHVILLPQYVSEDIQKKVKEELAGRGQSALADLARVAERAGVELQIRVDDTTTSVVNTICDFASTQGAGLIVLGTRGTGGVAKLMLGSVSAGVVRSAKCPVLVVR